MTAHRVGHWSCKQLAQVWSPVSPYYSGHHQEWFLILTQCGPNTKPNKKKPCWLAESFIGGTSSQCKCECCFQWERKSISVCVPSYRIPQWVTHSPIWKAWEVSSWIISLRSIYLLGMLLGFLEVHECACLECQGFKNIFPCPFPVDIRRMIYWVWWFGLHSVIFAGLKSWAEEWEKLIEASPGYLNSSYFRCIHYHWVELLCERNE